MDQSGWLFWLFHIDFQHTVLIRKKWFVKWFIKVILFWYPEENKDILNSSWGFPPPTWCLFRSKPRSKSCLKVSNYLILLLWHWRKQGSRLVPIKLQKCGKRPKKCEGIFWGRAGQGVASTKGSKHFWTRTNIDNHYLNYHR